MSEDFTYLENLISNRKVVRNYKKIEFDPEKLKNISNLIKFNPKKTKYSIDSKELSELIYIINKQSNNLYAEHIFKKISANYFRKSGSWRDSQKIMRFFLNKKVKIDNSEFNIEDGSGLSKYNSVTTSSIINLLEYATKRDYFNDFYNSLPIAAVSYTHLTLPTICSV